MPCDDERKQITASPRCFMMDAMSENESHPQLILDLEGFEGPLDLLLALARQQKVDLARISVRALADQYVKFLSHVRDIELAADYLVMAAWLIYLKSRLLMHSEDEDQEDAEHLSWILTFRLQKLDAMRTAAAQLMNRNRLGRDVFARGAPEGIRLVRRSLYEASLHELLTAYSTQKAREKAPPWKPTPLPVMPLEAARKRLKALMGGLEEWSPLDSLIPQGLGRRSAFASVFTATLEEARRGTLELRQTAPFTTLYVRRTPGVQTLPRETR